MKSKMNFALWTIALVSMSSAAIAYDYTSDMMHRCGEAGIDQRSMFGAPLCEVVDPVPLTMAEASKLGLKYRAVGWGKLFAADENGYFLPKSGEFIPRSWALSSSDNQFHRCTYEVNNYWSGPPDNEWKIRPDNGTADGKPPTLCFWRPSGKE